MIGASSNRHYAISSILHEWWPILLGLIVLYIPTYYAVSTTLWARDGQAQGQIVIIVALFLFWKNREYLKPDPKIETWPVLGALSLGFGLLCYMLGRSQDIFILDIFSQIPVFSGILLLTRGMPALRAMWFPLFFILFMLPLPGVLIDVVILPMKMAVSYVTENVLYWFGYPIGRSGVILQIGQYKLLVADACAGMQTLVSLEAMGLLYLNIVKHDSIFRNITLAILIVPISFTANVIRVIAITLITYYYGDGVGQGFVHGLAGMLLFVVALLLIISTDSLLQFSVNRWKKNELIDTKLSLK